LRSPSAFEVAAEESVEDEIRLSEDDRAPPPPEETERGAEMIEGEMVPAERGRDPEEDVVAESRRAERKNPSRDDDSRGFDSRSLEGAEELTLVLCW
jgi:hypothetical protein